MEKEKKIVIATHGELAKGFVSALNIIAGNTAGIEMICGYLNADFNLPHEIERIMEETDFTTTDLVVCTDLMGGSVNNEFVKYLGQYPFHLVTNINLAFLVDLVLTPGGVTEEMLNQKVKDDLVYIQYINNVVNQFDEVDDL